LGRHNPHRDAFHTGPALVLRGDPPGVPEALVLGAGIPEFVPLKEERVRGGPSGVAVE